MSGLKVFIVLTAAAIAGVGVAMAVTNPGQAAYETYATAKLTAYLKENACAKAPKLLGNVLQEECIALLDKNQDELRQFIVEGTERQNYIVVSIYKTDLSPDRILPPIVSDLVPAYHAETVGVFQQFLTIKVQER
ncbi:MAG TPA: DUF4359 domain-containing protein [Chroococcidiopsis sp.]